MQAFNIRIPTHVALAALSCSGLAFVLAGWFAWNRAEPQTVVTPANLCISCHSDAKTLKAMRDKAGIFQHAEWNRLEDKREAFRGPGAHSVVQKGWRKSF